MKKLILIGFTLLALSEIGLTQNFGTMYIPGFQLSHFKGSGVKVNESGTYADVKGNINHPLYKADGIVENIVFGCDISAFVHSLFEGLYKKGFAYYGGIFDFRIGGAFQLGDATKIGAGIDLGYRGIGYDKGDVHFLPHNYFIMGVTFVGLHAIDEKIYIMPKLSFDPMFGKDVDKLTDGMDFKFETTIGYRLVGGLGFTITPGIQRMKFLYLGTTPDYQEVVKKTQINTSFLQFGLSFMLD